MSLEFNVGEVAQRVRRALAVRGRMPLDLDERCGIQVQGLDADRAPYRGLDGAACYGVFTAPVGGATQYVGVIIQPGRTSTLVVRKLTFSVGSTGLDVMGSVVADAGVAATQLAIRPEIFTRSPFNFSRGPAGFLAALSAAGTPFLSEASACFSAAVPAPIGQVVQECDITVAPGFSLYLEARVPNIPLRVSLQGQSYDATVGS